MTRDFSQEELEPVAGDHTELTLGLGTLLGLGGGLLMLCAVCFALGYAVGHRSSSNQNAIVLPDSNTPVAAAKGGAKPGAVRQNANAPSPDAAASGSAGQADPARLSTSDESADASSTQAATPASDAHMRPALQPSSDAQSRVQPATSQAQGWMVQIAAVSRSEDADVLVSALRKRGYSVTERRELGDNLIHVQTGPFTSRNDANTMRQKLLSDGYNAIVQ